MILKRMTTINKSTQHYCSQKFWWLSVYPERKVISSCCSATPQVIDLTWLKNNPGRLFNIPELQEERQQMLDGVRVKSCEDECWKAEDSGLISRRLTMQSNIPVESNIEATPTALNIILGSDCNLTCVYCCKQYSTAWYRDIKTNGTYFDNDERFKINMVDKTVEALGQNQIKSSDFFQQILDECKQFKNLNKVFISGGEPFLYNGLPELINSLSGDLEIYTGLGVDNSRLERMLGKITNKFTLIVSAETTGKYYELARFGNTFKKFQENLETIRRLQIPYKFLSVLTNLTIFDFQNFQKQFGDQEINTQFCTDPDYLAVNVLDDISREKLLDSDFGRFTTDIHVSLKVIPTIDQQEKFSHYIQSFLSRRNISLDMYPESFTNWASLT